MRKIKMAQGKKGKGGFANNPELASEAGKKGGKAKSSSKGSGGNQRGG